MAKPASSLSRALVSGSAGSLASAIALAVCGQKENRRPASPGNAISHWLWGDRAFNKDGVTARYTLVGHVIHHVCSIMWATALEAQLRPGKPRSTRELLARASAVSALACFVDYRLTPDRFKPGYEQRLSKPSLFLVYASLALGLAAGAAVNDRLLNRRLKPPSLPRD